MMIIGIALFFIVIANFALGWLIWRQWQRPFAGTPLELIFANLTLGICVTGWFAFVLAEFGLFSLGRMLWLYLLLTATLIIRQPRAAKVSLTKPENHSPTPVTQWGLPSWLESIALLVWLVAALWLFFRPHEFIVGAADAGVYLNLSAEVAQRGGFLIEDKTLATLDTALYPALLRPLPSNSRALYYSLPGFYVLEVPAQQLVPQFYHLHSTWLAIGYSLGELATTLPLTGATVALHLVGLWALLGAVAIYLTVRQIAGWQTAMLTLAGLSINALQVWFARYPTAESLTLYLLWAGLWSLGAWLSDREPQPVWALLAGLTFGQLFLTRIDMLFILPILVALAVILWGVGRWQEGSRWFFIPLTILILHSVIHALWQSRPYFDELYRFGLRLFQVNWIIPLTAFTVGTLVLWFASQYRGQLTRLERFRRPALIAGVGILLVLALYAWFIRPYYSEVRVWHDPFSNTAIPLPNHENLLRLGWYLSPLGIWLGIVGVCFLLWQIDRKTAVMLAIGGFFSLFYLWQIRANPHQIYAMRRYVPATMPLFIIGAAYLLGWLTTHKWRWLTPTTAVLTLLWLGGLVWSARGFITHINYEGVMTHAITLEQQFNDDAIIIFNDQAPVGKGDFWGTPLKFLFGYDVFTLRNLEALDKALLVKTIENWHNNGRFVYWVGNPDWLDEQGFSYQQTHLTLNSHILENSFDHKPTAVIPIQWELSIAQLERE